MQCSATAIKHLLKEHEEQMRGSGALLKVTCQHFSADVEVMKVSLVSTVITQSRMRVSSSAEETQCRHSRECFHLANCTAAQYTMFKLSNNLTGLNTGAIACELFGLRGNEIVAGVWTCGADTSM